MDGDVNLLIYMSTPHVHSPRRLSDSEIFFYYAVSNPNRFPARSLRAQFLLGQVYPLHVLFPFCYLWVIVQLPTPYIPISFLHPSTYSLPSPSNPHPHHHHLPLQVQDSYWHFLPVAPSAEQQQRLQPHLLTTAAAVEATRHPSPSSSARNLAPGSWPRLP